MHRDDKFIYSYVRNDKFIITAQRLDLERNKKNIILELQFG